MKKDIGNDPVYDSGDGSYVVKKNKKLNIIAFIGCLVIALLIWVYVMSVENSDYTKTFSLSVELIGESELEEEYGLTVYGMPDALVNVTVQGTKADIQKYVEKDYRAYIDVSKLKEKGSYPITVSVETPSSAVSVASIEPLTSTVYVDIAVEKNIPVTAEISEEDDTVLMLSVSELTIEGAGTYVDKVASAKAVVSSDSIKDGRILYPTEIRLYDIHGVAVSSLYIRIVNEGITVTVTNVATEAADGNGS